MKDLGQLYYTVVSLLLMIVIYMINSSQWICFVSHRCIMNQVLSIVLYIAVPILLSYISLIMFKKHQSTELMSSNITMVESADSVFVPMYFAYIFIGLSIHSTWSLTICFAIITIISLFANTYIFNPILYVLGYRFYFVSNSKKNKLLIISKQKLGVNESADFKNIHRINDFTYIELNK